MDNTEAKAKFSGCYVATLTPFDSADHLDEGVARAHTQWLTANGVQGLCPAGTTGEFLYLSDEEKRRLVAVTVEAATGRVPVIAGVWDLRVDRIQGLAKAAENVGADAVFLPPPIYYPAGDGVILSYYEAVRKSVSIPVFAYNIPQYAANAISIECVDKLLRAGVIAGIKDSTGKAERVGELVERFGKTAVVFAASDSFASEGRKLGAAGFISAIANLKPDVFVRLWNGEDALQAEVDRLRTGLKQFGSISALKYLLGRRGFAFGASRLPFSSFTPEQQAILAELA